MRAAVRSPGRWLQVVGIGHTAVGAVLYRDVAAAMLRRGLVGTVPDRGDAATTFWFLLAGPLLWTTGHLLHGAEEAGDLRTQRTAGAAVAAIGLLGGVGMPASPFWTLVAAGAAAVRRGTRPAAADRGR